MSENSARPRRYAPWYNLSFGNLPVPALVSIFHRVSGAGLFLLLFFLLWLLDRSLVSPEGYADVKAVVGNPLAKLVLLGLLWSFMHHFFAGVRYLMLDMDKGIDLASARATAKLVFVASLVATVILGWVFLW